MKRFNQVYLLMALLGGVTDVGASSPAVNAIRVLRAIGVNGPVKPAVKPTPASTNTVPAGIVPPQAPAQPLAPVAVSQTAALANFGTTSSLTLEYQVEQLPVTAQVATLTMVALFGSTQSTSFTFDAETFIALNKSLASGQAVVVQVGTTAVDGNVVAYAGLFNMSDMSKMFGYALQSAPAGVAETDLTGFTVEYEFATATEANTINLAADQSLFILNPTVSIVNPLSGVSIQAVFGSAAKPVVSAPITFDATTVQAIQAALQANDIVTFSVDAEYMYGLGDIVVTAYDVTKNTQLGNEGTLAITTEQSDAGNFIAYVANLSMTGQSGQSAYVRGINQYLQLQVPAVASTNMAFYAPADLSVSIPEGSNFPNVTINGIFADGSSSAGFVFDAQDLQSISQAIANGDNVSIVVQQSSNGGALIASAYNINDFGMAVLATATNTVTPAQASQTLTGYALTYQLSGQAKPTVLQAQLGQVVTFGTSVYFTLSVDPATLTQPNCLDTRGSIMTQGGNQAITRGLRFAPSAFTKIQAALTAGHPVVIGSGYSAENQKMVMQAYDNVTKTVIAQVEQVSVHAAQAPLFGFIVDYQPGPNAQGQQSAPPSKILVPGGNVITLVPTTLTPATSVVGSVVRCLNRHDGPLASLQLQANFGSSGASETIALSDRELRHVTDVLQGDAAIFSASVQNNYCVFSVWDPQHQVQVITPKAVPAPAGTYSGFTIEYQSKGRNGYQGSIADVFSALQQAGAKVSNLGFNIPTGSSFSFINFNVGGSTGYGYPFGTSNPWNGSTSVGTSGLAADISSTISSISAQQWGAGISFMLVGLDDNNNVIGDITKTFPATFTLYIFDSMGNVLSNTLVPVGNMSFLSGTAANVTSFPNLTIETGAGNAQPVNNASENQTYPVLVTVNIGSSAAIAPTAASAALSGAAVNTVAVPAGQVMSLLVPQRVQPAEGQEGAVAAQALTLPSAVTPVSQLWFSPVFQQGYAELPLQTDPQLMTQINEVLAQGNEIQFVHQVVPTQYSQTVQGFDCIVTAYNMGNPEEQERRLQEIFTYVFPLIGLLGGPSGPVLQNNPWIYTNITYQFGSAPTVILPNLQTDNPSFSISGPVNISAAMKIILPKLESNFPGITQVYTSSTSNPVTVAYGTTLTALDMYVGSGQSWAQYVDLIGNINNDPMAVQNGQMLQGIPPRILSEGILILPVLFNVSGCNTQSGFIMDPSTIGGACSATCRLLVSSLNGRGKTLLYPAANFEYNDNGSQMQLLLNQGYENPKTISLTYGQPIILQLTANPPVGA